MSSLSGSDMSRSGDEVTKNTVSLRAVGDGIAEVIVRMPVKMASLLLTNQLVVVISEHPDGCECTGLCDCRS